MDNFRRAPKPNYYELEKGIRESIRHLHPDATDEEVERRTADMLLNHHYENVWLNSTYQVNVRDVEGEGILPGTTWLSIKRRDKEPIHDWRDLQEIKTKLCGPEREAVEVYPAESRVVDTANQFHLWVLPEGQRVPFGFDDGRIISDTPMAAGAKQRPRERSLSKKQRQKRKRWQKMQRSDVLLSLIHI